MLGFLQNYGALPLVCKLPSYLGPLPISLLFANYTSAVFLTQPSPALTLAWFLQCIPAAAIANFLASCNVRIYHCLLPLKMKPPPISLRMLGIGMSELLDLSLTVPLPPSNMSAYHLLPLLACSSGTPPLCILHKSPLTSSGTWTHPFYPSFMSSSPNWGWSQAQIFSPSLLKNLSTCFTISFV